MLCSQFTLLLIHLHRFWSELIEHVWKSLRERWRNNTHSTWFILSYKHSAYIQFIICNCRKRWLWSLSASNIEIMYVDDLYGNVILNNLQMLYEVFEFHDILEFFMIAFLFLPSTLVLSRFLSILRPHFFFFSFISETPFSFFLYVYHCPNYVHIWDKLISRFSHEALSVLFESDS